jgi:threonine dehydrogenase-like Zn-dependent dehydrogenase
VCGSDLHWFKGHFPPPPVVPGHEITAEVVECGAGVLDLKAGERVAVEPLRVCNRCTACRAGDYQVCAQGQILGLACDGGFAEYLTMPRDRVYRLPADLDFVTGALTEPTAVCVHGARLGNVGLGDRVLVLGAGSIGLLSVMAARAAGATDVAITARYEHQAAMARRLGATRVFRSSADGTRECVTFAGDCPVDVVIETVGGSADTLDKAVELVRPGGTVVVLGVFLSAVALNALLLVVKEARIVGSLTYGRSRRRADFENAMQILSSHAAVAGEMVTHRFALDQIQLGFETASNKKQGAIKVSVAP